MRSLLLVLLIFISPVSKAIVSTLTPSMDVAAWDTRYFGAGTNTLAACDPAGTANNPATCSHYFAWIEESWLKSYLSMAVLTGDTKYIDKAKTVVDYMLANRSAAGGWGWEIDNSEYFLQSGMISQVILQYVYVVHKDKRFSAYRTAADGYLTTIEAIIHSFDYQWVDNSPLGSLGASFYRYATCTDGRSLCGTASLVMYNQGAAMAKAGLLAYRIYQLKGLSPDAGYLDKATKSAQYFMLMHTPGECVCTWKYSGARTDAGNAIEDLNHGHIDLMLLNWTNGLGGMDETMLATISNVFTKKIMNGDAGMKLVSNFVDGTGTASTGAIETIANDWIELANYNPMLMDLIIEIYNTDVSNNSVNGANAYGWAEIMRKIAGIEIIYGQ